MKGIFYWFKDSSKMKRWIMLILVGIVFCSFGMANMIVSEEAITLVEAAKIIFCYRFYLCSIRACFYKQKKYGTIYRSNR